MLERKRERGREGEDGEGGEGGYVAACCSVMQCVAVCCSVLQCDLPDLDGSLH